MRGAQVIAGALEAAGGVPAGVAVERRVAQGRGVDVLIDESRDADLLVVGARGFGGFRGLLLGSTSRQCVQHALCPVAVVRPGNRARVA